MTDLEEIELAVRRAAMKPGLSGYGVGALLRLADEIARINNEKQKKENSDAPPTSTS